jgi:hypothetical protein
LFTIAETVWEKGMNKTPKGIAESRSIGIALSREAPRSVQNRAHTILSRLRPSLLGMVLPPTCKQARRN